MKVKIGEKIYSSEEEPLMIIFSDSDKVNIMDMAPEATRYASFPEGWGSEDEMLAWMKGE